MNVLEVGPLLISVSKFGFQALLNTTATFFSNSIERKKFTNFKVQKGNFTNTLEIRYEIGS